MTFLQTGHLQLHFPGLGLQLASIVASPCIDAVRGMLVSLRLAHGIGLGIQHLVQRFLHTPPNQLAQVLLDIAFVNTNHFTQWLCAIFSHGGGSPGLYC